MKIWLLLLLALAHTTAHAEPQLECDNPSTTLAINQCLHQQLMEADQTMEHYYAKSLARFAQSETIIASIEQGQLAWLDYRNAHCVAVYDL